MESVLKLADVVAQWFLFEGEDIAAFTSGVLCYAWE